MSRPAEDTLVHGSAVAIGGRGILILGPSGAGKSGLALRLMALGAGLVADDRVILRAEAGGVVAAAPDALAGLVEARGVGLLRVAPHAPVRLAYAVDLGRPATARMPQSFTIALLGVEVDLICGAATPNLEAILTILALNARGS